MGYSSLLKSPKKEEQQVPDSSREISKESFDSLEDLESLFGIDRDEKPLPVDNMYGVVDQLDWDFMEEDDEIREKKVIDQMKSNVECCLEEERLGNERFIKRENVAFLDEEEKMRVSLNLNLNYEEILDAWSDRGSLWADDGFSPSFPNKAYYMGEVPVMEEEKRRREASVLRYKEKRQTRLFSKKIRYQVRKLNADKRPRMKGRFVKTVS